MDFADGFREVGGGDNPADAPSGDRVGLAHAVDEDGAVAHAREGHHRDVLRSVVDDVLVYFVRDGEGVELLAQLGDEFELLSIEDLAGGVAGRVQNDSFRARRERGAELLRVIAPIGGIEADELAAGAAEQRVWAVVLIVGLEDDDFVAGIHRGEQRRDHSFGRAAADRDFALGV